MNCGVMPFAESYNTRPQAHSLLVQSSLLNRLYLSPNLVWGLAVKWALSSDHQYCKDNSESQHCALKLPKEMLLHFGGATALVFISVRFSAVDLFYKSCLAAGWYSFQLQTFACTALFSHHKLLQLPTWRCHCLGHCNCCLLIAKKCCSKHSRNKSLNMEWMNMIKA